jgi:hypothetical protein
VDPGYKTSSLPVTVKFEPEPAAVTFDEVKLVIVATLDVGFARAG